MFVVQQSVIVGFGASMQKVKCKKNNHRYSVFVCYDWNWDFPCSYKHDQVVKSQLCSFLGLRLDLDRFILIQYSSLYFVALREHETEFFFSFLFLGFPIRKCEIDKKKIKPKIKMKLRIKHLLAPSNNPIQWYSPSNSYCLIVLALLFLALDSLPNNQHHLWLMMRMIMKFLAMTQTFWLFDLSLFVLTRTKSIKLQSQSEFKVLSECQYNNCYRLKYDTFSTSR